MGKDTKQPGGIPNRPYDAPKEDPKNPYVPAPKLVNIFHPETTKPGGSVNDNKA